MPILYTNNMSTGKMTVLGHEVVICGYHTYYSDAFDEGGVRVYVDGTQVLLVKYNYADIEDDGFTARLFTVGNIQFKLSVVGDGQWKVSLVDQVGVPIVIPPGADYILSIDSFKNIEGGYPSLTYEARIASMSVQ